MDDRRMPGVAKIGTAPTAVVVAASEAYFPTRTYFSRWLDEECVVVPGNETAAHDERSPLGLLAGVCDRHQNRRPNERSRRQSQDEARLNPYHTRTERGFLGVLLRNGEQVAHGG